MQYLCSTLSQFPACIFSTTKIVLNSSQALDLPRFHFFPIGKNIHNSLCLASREERNSGEKMDGGKKKQTTKTPHGQTEKGETKRGIFWIFLPWVIYKQSVSLSGQTRGKAKLRVHKMTFFKHLNKQGFNPASSSNLFSHQCQQCQMLQHKVQEFHGRQTWNNLLSQGVPSYLSQAGFKYKESTISLLLFSENYLFPFEKFLRLLGLTEIILPSFVVQEPSGKRALGLIRHLMKNSVKN